MTETRKIEKILRSRDWDTLMVTLKNGETRTLKGISEDLVRIIHEDFQYNMDFLIRLTRSRSMSIIGQTIPTVRQIGLNETLWKVEDEKGYLVNDGKDCFQIKEINSNTAGPRYDYIFCEGVKVDFPPFFTTLEKAVEYRFILLTYYLNLEEHKRLMMLRDLEVCENFIEYIKNKFIEPQTNEGPECSNLGNIDWESMRKLHVLRRCINSRQIKKYTIKRGEHSILDFSCWIFSRSLSDSIHQYLSNLSTRIFLEKLGVGQKEKKTFSEIKPGDSIWYIRPHYHHPDPLTTKSKDLGLIRELKVKEVKRHVGFDKKHLMLYISSPVMDEDEVFNLDNSLMVNSGTTSISKGTGSAFHWATTESEAVSILYRELVKKKERSEEYIEYKDHLIGNLNKAVESMRTTYPSCLEKYDKVDIIKELEKYGQPPAKIYQKGVEQN